MENAREKQEVVSIVIPVYNAGAYIDATVQSVISQTYQNWELLLVEDCSTDNTLSQIQNYQDDRIRVLRQPKNQGAAKARNRGVTEATGRYLAFLDADDIWKPEKLERELQFMRQKKAAFVCMSYEFADEQGIGNGKIAHVPASLTYKEALKNTIIFTSTVLFDLTKIEKQLLMMPEVGSEDTATWWQILRTGYTVYGLDEALIYYRRPLNSLSSNKLLAIKRIWNLYRKVEGLSFCKSAYNFLFYAVRTTRRRL